jgi:hypothetical protein
MSKHRPIVIHLISTESSLYLHGRFDITFIQGPKDLSAWRSAGRKEQLALFAPNPKTWKSAID